MNKELIKQWAVESGFARHTFKIDVEGRSNLRLKFDESKLSEFAALVAAHEREQCANLVQQNAMACEAGSMLQVYLSSNAAAIRSRKDAR